MLVEQDQDAAVVLAVCPAPETWAMLRDALRGDSDLFSLREAATGAEALRAVGVPPWDIDGIVLGAQLPDAERIDLLDKLRAAEFDRPVVVLTADGAEPSLNGHGNGLVATSIDVRDLSLTPGVLPRALVAAIEARRRAHFEVEVHRLRAERDALERGLLQSLEALAAAIAAREVHAGTGRRELCAVEIARELGLAEAEQRGLWAAALLHDIGNLVVPGEVLNKPGPLTPEERAQVQTHAEVGARLLERVELPWPVAETVRCHHERHDGSGYPRGIAGEQIPLSARILAVAEVYGALTADRPYRPALSPRAAAQWILDQQGALFDPPVVRAFAQAIGRVEALYRARPAERAAATHPVAASADDRGSPVVAIRAVHEEATTLTRLAQCLAAAPSLSAAASAVATAACELLPTAGCAVYLTRRGDALDCVAAAGPMPDPHRRIDTHHCRNLASRVLQSGEVSTNGTRERLRSEQPAHATSGEVTAAPLSLPTGRRIGVLLAVLPPGAAFSADAVRRLEVLSQHAAAPLEAARSADDARAAALVDAVTGLPDGRYLMQELTRELAWCQRSQATGCVLYLDLNGFRLRNMRFGREHGDETLRGVAAGLTGAARAHDLVARYGGDEFVVIARNAALPDARRIAKRMRAAVARALDTESERLTCTIGMAEYNSDVTSAELLVTAAQNAMYRLKRVRGRR